MHRLDSNLEPETRRGNRKGRVEPPALLPASEKIEEEGGRKGGGGGDRASSPLT